MSRRSSTYGYTRRSLQRLVKEEPMAQPEKEWFQTEDGIRSHYAEAREAEAKRHQQNLKSLNDDELMMLEALRRSQAENYVGKLFTVTGREDI